MLQSNIWQEWLDTNLVMIRTLPSFSFEILNTGNTH